MILLVFLALVVASACSNKNKKAETTPVAPEPSAASQEVAEVPEQREEEPLPEPEPEPAEPSAELSTVYFAFDSAVLSDEARARLDENARWLEQNPDGRLVIEGHTDPKGTDEYNIALGQSRAQAAYDYLLRLGVSADRISTVSYGEERLADPDRDERNRRSEFVPR